MLDLPPQQQPTQEVQKMDQKNILIQKVRALCRKSMRLNNDATEGKCSLDDRAIFLDVCNATNANEIFSFKAASWLVEGCKDGFVPGATDNYLLDAYHIEGIWGLEYTIENEGKGGKALKSLPEANSYGLGAIYTIMVDNPDFTPKFTKFAFGGTMKDMPPLRLEDGKPNPEFFRKWSSETAKMFE